MVKKLYLSIELAQESIQSKDRLEALAFNIMIKHKYTSSTVNNATIRKCKETFGIGSTRMSRIIENGIAFGFLKRFGNHLIAQKIKSDGLNCLIEFEDRDYSLTEIMDIIRNSVLLNHIRKQTFVSDTVRKARDPKNQHELRVAQKRIKRMPNFKKDSSCGLSNKRIMQVTNTKLYRAKKLIRHLVASKKVTKKEIIVDTNIKPEDFTRGFREWYKSTGLRGFMLFDAKRHVVCCQLSNQYTYTCANIRMI